MSGSLFTSGRRTFYIAAVAAGVFARLWLWLQFIGSADAHIWSQHAHSILVHGIVYTYQNVAIFNHPPLPGWFAAVCSYLSAGSTATFARLLKVPSLLADFAAIALLWRYVSPLSAVIFAVSPVAILVSGFHGNTDSVCAVFMLAGTLAADRRRWFTAGGLFAAALNVKLVPLLLLPVLLLAAPRRDLLRLAGGLSLAIIPFLPPAVFAAPVMVRNVFNYLPPAQDWGLLAFFDNGIRQWYRQNGRLILSGAILVYSVISGFFSSATVSRQLAVVCALWLLLTPGFGVQYLIYPLPLLCITDRFYAWLWSATAGAMLTLDYLVGFKYDLRGNTSWLQPIQNVQPVLLLGVAACTVLWIFVMNQLRFGWHKPSA